MALQDKLFYNRASAEKLGWEPSWFGAKEFDEVLLKNIKKFQKEYNITADALCGPTTFRLANSAREMEEDLREEELLNGNYIICEGQQVPIEWDKVVNLKAENNLALPKGFRKYKENKRKPTMIVTHFDVCLSAASCKRVLEKKGISSHFAIDNDGTIYQMVDPQHEAWHAGTRRTNKASVGVDISNAYYTKYQKWYRRKGFGNRPVLNNLKVHGVTLKECLGFYPIQIQAYKALISCLCKQYDIPVECPLNSEGTLLRAVYAPAKRGKYNGIVNHFHLTRKKIDTANLEMDKILEEIRNGE